MANFLKAYELSVGGSVTCYINPINISSVRIEDTGGGIYKGIATVDGVDFVLYSFEGTAESDIEDRVRILFGGLLGWNAAG